MRVVVLAEATCLLQEKVERAALWDDGEDDEIGRGENPSRIIQQPGACGYNPGGGGGLTCPDGFLRVRRTACFPLAELEQPGRFPQMRL